MFDLPECQEIMWEVYNPRCEPPWEEYERHHFNSVIERAYKYANNAAGCKTCIGKFSALRAVEPLPEPTGGWEADALRGQAAAKRAETPPIPMVIDEPFNIIDTHDDSARLAQLGGLIAQATNKSAPLDLARIFLLSEFPNGNLIRNQKVFYEYNGKCWNETSDDGIKSLIMHYFAQVADWKLAPSKVNNIYVTIEQLVHKEQLNLNTWMDGRTHTGATNILRNCITELIDGELVVKPHSNQYFSLIMLDFNFEEVAEWS